MKRLLAVALVALTAFVGPSVAADTGKVIEGSGERINIFGAPTIRALDEPFHIAHGWLWSPGETRYAKADSYFVLIMDNVVLEPTGVGCRVDLSPENPDDCLFYMYDFPEGLAGRFPGITSGTHVFEGQWYTTCVGSLDARFGARDGCEGTPSWNPTLLTSQGVREVFFTEE